MSGHEPKALLMRVYGDLMRAKAAFGELSNQTTDITVQNCIKRLDERILEDIQWVKQTLRDKIGVNP